MASDMTMHVPRDSRLVTRPFRQSVRVDQARPAGWTWAEKSLAALMIAAALGVSAVTYAATVRLAAPAPERECTIWRCGGPNFSPATTEQGELTPGLR